YRKNRSRGPSVASTARGFDFSEPFSDSLSRPALARRLFQLVVLLGALSGVALLHGVDRRLAVGHPSRCRAGALVTGGLALPLAAIYHAPLNRRHAHALLHVQHLDQGRPLDVDEHGGFGAAAGPNEADELEMPIILGRLAGIQLRHAVPQQHVVDAGQVLELIDL